MNDSLFIFWWLKSEIQWVNKKQVQKNQIIEKWDSTKKIKKLVQRIVNESRGFLQKYLYFNIVINL